MPEESKSISCSKSLTITTLYPNSNISGTDILIGYNGGNIFRSYLYFDLSGIPFDSTINFAILKLNVQNYISPYNSIALNIYPLVDEFSQTNTTYNNQPSYYSLKVETNYNFNDVLEIDIKNIVSYWVNDGIKNNGILIKSDEIKQSLIICTSALSSNQTAIPQLVVNYTPNGGSKETFVTVLEQNLSLEFNQHATSPAINIMRIIQGTFFLYNDSSLPVTATIEVSADSEHWKEEQSTIIDAYDTTVLVAQYYGKFYRLKFESTSYSKIYINFIYQNYK